MHFTIIAIIFFIYVYDLPLLIQHPGSVYGGVAFKIYVNKESIKVYIFIFFLGGSSLDSSVVSGLGAGGTLNPGIYKRNNQICKGAKPVHQNYN